MLEKLPFNQQILEGSINFHSFNDEYDDRELTEAPVKVTDVQIAQFYLNLN